MRDVVEEMSLHGVRPDRQTYLIGLFSAMRGRKIAEAWYYWDEMRRHGHAPDVSAALRWAMRQARWGALRRLWPLAAQ